MLRRFPAVLLSSSLLLCLAIAGGCSGRGGGRPGPRDGSVVPRDGSGRDGGGSINPCTPGCGDQELCGEMGDGNGLDEDCDGMVDEDCPCPAVGITRPCFAGPPDRRNIGACADGIETCSEFLTWSSCIGGISPGTESCDSLDNDCNGITDDIPGCTSAVACPVNEASPPLSNYALRGDRVYTGAARGWSWRIECPASVPADLCPAPESPMAEDTQVYFTASGAYRVYVEVILEDGSMGSCAWTVYVQGTGLRVELNWDTMLDTAGGTDVDLHLHRWNNNGTDTDWFNDDDCYYGNCTPTGSITWADHPPSNLENCADAPHGGGAEWSAVGSCRNPRLDVDTNGIDGSCYASTTDPNDPSFCAPENINVDSPIVGMPYRVMVNYYSDEGYSAMTNTWVNIFCGGALRASFGLDPFVFLREGSGFGAANDNWYVADVVFFRGTCGMDCMVHPLGGMARGTLDPSDPFGFSAILPFGPPWSCTYDASAGTCTP